MLPGTWKMPVPWFLLSLALGRNPVVISLERIVGPQDAARCSPGLSCHLWGHWEEPEDEEKSGGTAELELKEPRNVSLQAQVVLSFQAYSTARCVLLQVQVPVAQVQPGQSVGSLEFDCFEAALGAEIRIWSYTQPRYQKELNLMQQLPGKCPRASGIPGVASTGSAPMPIPLLLSTYFYPAHIGRGLSWLPSESVPWASLPRRHGLPSPWCLGH